MKMDQYVCFRLDRSTKENREILIKHTQMSVHVKIPILKHGKMLKGDK